MFVARGRPAERGASLCRSRRGPHDGTDGNVRTEPGRSRWQRLSVSGTGALSRWQAWPGRASDVGEGNEPAADRESGVPPATTRRYPVRIGRRSGLRRCDPSRWGSERPGSSVRHPRIPRDSYVETARVLLPVDASRSVAGCRWSGRVGSGRREIGGHVGACRARGITDSGRDASP